MRSPQRRRLRAWGPRLAAERRPAPGEQTAFPCDLRSCFASLVSFLFVSVRSSAADTLSSSLVTAGDPLRAGSPSLPHPALSSHASRGGPVSMAGASRGRAPLPASWDYRSEPSDGQSRGSGGGRRSPAHVVGVERVLTPKEGILPGAGVVLEYSWPQTPESLQQNSGTEESVRTEARGPADRALQWASHVNVKCF